MSKNSKTKRDKKKAAEKKAARTKAHNAINFDNPTVVQRELSKLFDPAKLTTPRDITADIVSFCVTIGETPAFFIESQPEPWSRQACCDSNVVEYIRLNGGEMVCGYKIWYNEPNYIEAERHAIWRDGTQVRDVSFSGDGEVRCLFVPDVLAKQSRLEDNALRIRWCKDHQTKKLIKIQEGLEAAISTERMTDEQAWNTMPSYEQWLAGTRMSAMISVDDPRLAKP